MSCVINHRDSTVSAFLSFLNVWPPRLATALEKWHLFTSPIIITTNFFTYLIYAIYNNFLADRCSMRYADTPIGIGVHIYEVYLLTYLLTYSMVQSPSWAADWFAAGQEIPHISRNPKVHCHTHKRMPPVPILGQPNPAHMPTSHHIRGIIKIYKD